MKLKLNYLLLLLVFQFTELSAQTSPPSGYKRGMYVDCMSDMIWDIHNSNPTNAKDLLDYAQSHNFTYVALFGLDHTGNSNFPNGFIMGDPNFEPDIYTFILMAHTRHINVGIVISDKSFLQNNYSPNYNWDHSQVRIDCVSDQFRPMVNPSTDEPESVNLKAEMCKAALRTANYNSIANYSTGYADCISIEYEYWTPAFYTDHPQYVDGTSDSKELFAYNDLIDLLSFTRQLICSSVYGPLHSEMELRLKTYTSTLNTIPSPLVQATDIDYTAVDRILLVDYQYNATGLFGYNCDNLNWLGDQQTGGVTQIWNSFSAESINFTKDCFATTSTNTWGPFLGDYLAGLGTTYLNNPHTLRDAENQWLDDLNNATSASCPNCSCSFSNGDNNITGFMWFLSSIIFNQTFQRIRRDIPINSEIQINNLNQLLIVKGAISTDNINISDVQGRIYFKNKFTGSPITLNFLSSGIYFCSIIDENDVLLKTEKIVIVN